MKDDKPTASDLLSKNHASIARTSVFCFLGIFAHNDLLRIAYASLPFSMSCSAFFM